MSDDSYHSIQGSEIVLSGSESAEGRGISGISSSLGIEFPSKSTNILRFVVYDREHSTKKQQITSLYCFDIRAKRRRGGGEFNPKILQPALRAFRL
jgi:hypothetical protein